MSNIIKVYFTNEADIDFIKQYTKLMNELFPEDIVVAIPQGFVSDVIFTMSVPNKEGVDYPF